MRVSKTIKFLLRYWRDKKAWLAQGGTIDNTHRILRDYTDNAGISSGHYFHQDLLVARLIAEKSPKRHVDVGSRIDGFVAHVASFRPIEVIDIRSQPQSEHRNITFVQADLMSPQDIGKTDSLSCLHAIEHFGLGRYGDPINVKGHIDGIEHLISLLADDGTLYLSFPIGRKDETHFNAHRVFHPATIPNLPSIKKSLTLERFDYVDDKGNLHTETEPETTINNVVYGCGIYTFRKV